MSIRPHRPRPRGVKPLWLVACPAASANSSRQHLSYMSKMWLSSQVRFIYAALFMIALKHLYWLGYYIVICIITVIKSMKFKLNKKILFISPTCSLSVFIRELLERCIVNSIVELDNMAQRNYHDNFFHIYNLFLFIFFNYIKKISTIFFFISVDIDNYHDKCHIFISFKFKGRFLLQCEPNQTVNCGFKLFFMIRTWQTLYSLHFSSHFSLTK